VLKLSIALSDAMFFNDIKCPLRYCPLCYNFLWEAEIFPRCKNFCWRVIN